MVDRKRLALRRAIRVAVVAPIGYVIANYGLGLGPAAMLTVFAVFALLALTDFGGRTGPRFWAYILTGFVGTIAIALGTFASYHLVSAIIGTVVFVFVVAFAAVLRGYVATATTALLLPFVIAVTSATPLPDLPATMLAFAVGTVLSAVAAITLWPVHRVDGLRRFLADALRACAHLVQATWALPAGAVDDTDPTSRAARARDLMARHAALHNYYDGHLDRPGSASERDRALGQIVEQLDRVSVGLLWQSSDVVDPSAADADLALATAASLRDCADCLASGGASPDAQVLERARMQHLSATEDEAAALLGAGDVDATHAHLDRSFRLRLASLGSEIITTLTPAAAGQSITTDQQSLFEGTGLPIAGVSARESLRRQFTLSSPWFRNSARTSLAVAAAVAVAHIGHFDHGFWVVLGALTALRFDALGTSRTALQAILGTTIGFVAAFVGVSLVGDNVVVYAIAFPLAVFGASYASSAISFVSGQAMFTLFVVVLLGLIDGPSTTVAEVRLIDVAAGLGVSLLVSALMWPRGVYPQVRRTLANSVRSSATYLVATYERLSLGPVVDDLMASESNNARAAVALANETFDLAASGRGTSGPDYRHWALASNVSAQVIYSADLIRFLMRTGKSIGMCPDVADRVLVCAHVVRAQLSAAADRIASAKTLAGDGHSADAILSPYRPSRSNTTSNDSLERLTDSVRKCFTQLADEADPATVGRSAQTLAVVEEWISHLMWLSDYLNDAFRDPDRKDSPTSG